MVRLMQLQREILWFSGVPAYSLPLSGPPVEIPLNETFTCNSILPAPPAEALSVDLLMHSPSKPHFCLFTLG